MRYSVHFLMTTRTMCCYLHGDRVGRFVGGFGGRPLGAVPCALFDDDTHDVLLVARETQRRFRGRAVTVGAILCALFDDDTHDVLLLTR